MERHLPLCLGQMAVQAVAPPQNIRLPRGQLPGQQLMQQTAVLLLCSSSSMVSSSPTTSPKYNASPSGPVSSASFSDTSPAIFLSPEVH